MNQILVTEKIYVTPELKRKKKIYKILLMLSIFSMITLFSIYIYAEYDRNKDESMSKDILAFLQEDDDTIMSDEEDALIVLLTQDIPEDIEVENTGNEQTTVMNTATATTSYVASDGKTYESIGIIDIPKINLHYVILSTTSVELLRVAPCKFWGGNPNEVGNLCIAGHNYRRKGKFFSEVPTLVVGDIVEITDLSQRKIQYEVYDIHTVDPGDNSDTTQYTNGRKEVTLITCTNDNKQRVIVKCKEKI